LICVKRFVFSAIAIGTLLGLQGCAAFMPQACGPGLMRMTQAQLFFGRDIQRRTMVTDAQWRDFLDQEVTPRFPAGFSVSDIYGQYRNVAGQIAREQSKELLIISQGDASDDAKLNAIRDAYKSRFNQESVLLVESPVCAGF
jgi:hypothetical protein